MTTLAQLKEMMETFQRHGLSLTECEKVLREVPKLLAFVEAFDSYAFDLKDENFRDLADARKALDEKTK